MPALDFAAVEGGFLFLGAKLVARRVAGAAMAESLHQVRAAIPVGAARAVGLVYAGLEIARFPDADESARDRQLVRAVFLAHGLARHEKGVERGDVLVRDLGEMIVRERGIEVLSLAIDAFAHRTAEGCELPAANAGVRVGRDVGAVDRAERRLDRR